MYHNFLSLFTIPLPLSPHNLFSHIHLTITSQLILSYSPHYHLTTFFLIFTSLSPHHFLSHIHLHHIAHLLSRQPILYLQRANCHQETSVILREMYSKPSFLPKDSESSTLDWIFMGWPGMGAYIHVSESNLNYYGDDLKKLYNIFKL